MYRIVHNGEVVGSSELGHLDPAMGVAHGRFRPAEAYASIRAVFQLLVAATGDPGARSDGPLREYYRQRDALHLALVDESGRVVETGTIHIEDRSAELGLDAVECSVIVNDAVFWVAHGRA